MKEIISRTKVEEMFALQKGGFLKKDKIQLSETTFIVDPKTLKIHDLAKAHPSMMKADYESLRDDIEMNAQLVPIMLYRGIVIDGRHRLKAILELGIKYIICTSQPNNSTIEDLKNIIRSTEMRRHQTKSQLAIQAYFEYKKYGGTQQTYANKFQVSKSDISRAKFIEERRGPKFLKELLNKGQILLENERYYSSLDSIAKYLKKLEVTKAINTREINEKDLSFEMKKIMKDIQSIKDNHDYINLGYLKQFMHDMKIEGKNKELLDSIGGGSIDSIEPSTVTTKEVNTEANTDGRESW